MCAKSKNESTSIALLDTPAKIKPPLKKRELIEALALRKRQLLKREAKLSFAENDRNRSLFKKKIAEFHQRVAAGIKGMEPQEDGAPEAWSLADECFNRRGGATFSVFVPKGLIPKDILDLSEKIAQWKNPGAIPSVAEIRKQLMEGGTTDSRIAMAMEDETFVASLDQVLAGLDRQADAKESIAV